jgi:hypothetical protein
MSQRCRYEAKNKEYDVSPMIVLLQSPSMTSSFVNEPIFEGKEPTFTSNNLTNLVNSSIPIKEKTKPKHLRSKQEF